VKNGLDKNMKWLKCIFLGLTTSISFTSCVSTNLTLSQNIKLDDWISVDTPQELKLYEKYTMSNIPKMGPIVDLDFKNKFIYTFLGYYKQPNGFLGISSGIKRARMILSIMPYQEDSSSFINFYGYTKSYAYPTLTNSLEYYYYAKETSYTYHNSKFIQLNTQEQKDNYPKQTFIEMVSINKKYRLGVLYYTNDFDKNSILDMLKNIDKSIIFEDKYLDKYNSLKVNF
jgi:hypothetical protein